MLDIDEAALTLFFGELPKTQDSEEAEFFGAKVWEVCRENLRLYVLFSTHDHEVSLTLYADDNAKPTMESCVKLVSEVRIQDRNNTLVLMGKAMRDAGSDPQLTERVRVTLNPLSVEVRESW